MITIEHCALIRDKVKAITTRHHCERIMHTVNRLGQRAACKRYGRLNIMRALAYLRSELSRNHTAT